MYVELFSALGLQGSVTSEVSQAVEMQGANAAQVSAIVFALSGSGSPAVSLQLQESNDLENWSDKGSATSATAVGFKMCTAVTSIAAAYIRLKITLAGGATTAVVAGGVNTSAL